jgi:hypothetical protein
MTEIEIMQDEKLTKLVNSTGCDPVLAKLLLKFTDDDLDGAMKIMESVDKDIYVVRGKFIAQGSKVYGTFIFFYNTKSKEIYRLNMVIKKEERAAIEFSFKLPWREFEKKLVDYGLSNLIKIDLQDKFAFQMKTPKAISTFEKFMVRKKEHDEQALKAFFTEVVFNLTGDSDIAIKLHIERTDAFELNKGNVKETDIIFKEEKEEADVKEEIDENNDDVLNLRIEPELSPGEGTEITLLRPGDIISVKIADERPIAEYIATLLNAKEPVTNENIMIYSKVKDIITTEQGFVVKVEFGPGINGIAYFGENVKLRVAKIDEAIPEETQLSDNIFIRNFWIIGGILVVGIVILLLLITKP